jgi:hypothetical protein
MSSPGGRPTTATDDLSARTQLASWYAQGLSDGFGDRLLMFDNAATGPLELLRVRPDFGLVASFETALRARVEQLSSFAHPGFAHARSVNHLDDGEGLTVVSVHVPGTRLSDLFESTRASAGMHPASVRWALGEMIAALAELHRLGDGVAHGTLTADHVVITADRRVVITDYVFGDALAGLALPVERLWTEFGIIGVPSARPGSPDPLRVSLDQRGDVVQAALLILSLVLGRRIAPDEYPRQLPRLLEEFSAASSRRAPDAALPLLEWIEEALDPAGFRSAVDAERPLIPGPKQIASPPRRGAAPAAPSAAAGLDPPAPLPFERPSPNPPVRLAPAAGPQPIAIDPVQPPPSPLPQALAPIEFPDAAALEAAQDAVAEEPDHGAVPPARPRWLWVTAALAAVAILEGAVITRLLSRPPAPVAPVQITIDSAMPGDTVLVNGQVVGVTPLDLPIGSVSGPVRVMPQPPEAVAGSVLAMSSAPQTTAAPASSSDSAANVDPDSGGVRIVTPITLQVIEGNRVLGSSANGPVILSPGAHELEFVNNALGFRTRQTVRVAAGRISPLTVTLPNGTISINAQPWAQVFIDGRAIGDTPLANIPVAIGEHEVVFRHPKLGERRQKTTVQAGVPARVSASFTQ